MRTFTKRLLAIALAAILVTTLVPVPALGVNDTDSASPASGASSEAAFANSALATGKIGLEEDGAASVTFQATTSRSGQSKATARKKSKAHLSAAARARRIATKRGVVKVYRLANLWTGSYIFTASLRERRQLVHASWLYEGVGFLVPKRSSTPVYRLMNKNSGDHVYTASPRQRNDLHKRGWRNEGIAWYALDGSKVASRIAKRANTKAGKAVTTFASSQNGMARRHLYVASNREKAQLKQAGWKAGKRTWQALSAGWPVPRIYKHDHWECLLGQASSEDAVTAHNGSLDSAAQASLEGLLDDEAYIDFIGINTKTGKVVSRNADTWHYGASTVKAPYVASLCMYDAPGIGGWQSQMHAIVTYSSNELFMSIAGAYGHGWFDRMAEASQTEIAYTAGGPFAEFTPRRLVMLWATIADYLTRGGPNIDLFRGLFGNGGFFKEGWMYAGMYGGRCYHVAGVDGDCVYAIMTGFARPNDTVWKVKDALVSALQ